MASSHAAGAPVGGNFVGKGEQSFGDAPPAGIRCEQDGRGAGQSMLGEPPVGAELTHACEFTLGLQNDISSTCTCTYRDVCLVPSPTDQTALFDKCRRHLELHPQLQSALIMRVPRIRTHPNR